MHKITKLFEVPIGHRLSKHEGYCQNLHGHNFRIEITLSSETLGEDDMVLDFSDLKKIVSSILEPFDHCMVLNPTDNNNTCHVSDNKYRLVTISSCSENIDPTAEVLSKYLFFVVDDAIKVLKRKNDPRVESVRVWENSTGMAEFSL